MGKIQNLPTGGVNLPGAGQGTPGTQPGSFDFGNTLSIAGGIFSALQAYNAGQAGAEQYEYAARQYDRQGRDIMDAAHRDIVMFRRGKDKFTASQRAALAANGMAGSQSALELLSDTEKQAAMDELAIKYNADLRAREMGNQANYARMSAENTRRAGLLQGMQGLISMAGMVNDSWYRYSRTSGGAKR